jgi:hypothetical protein
MKRRAFVQIVTGIGLCPTWARAAPSELEEKRLQNRLELWHNYAARTRNLLARVTTTRTTSLLDAPLVVTGTLAFSAPATLVLRDDGLGGSTTRIDGQDLRLTLNRADAGRDSLGGQRSPPAASWVADRLVRMFAPGAEQDLVMGARTHVPHGRGYRLELMPPRGSLIRKTVRSMTVTLDPVAGAVVEIAIAEAQGDRVHLRLTDHRQNVSDEDIEALVEPA